MPSNTGIPSVMVNRVTVTAEYIIRSHTRADMIDPAWSLELNQIPFCCICCCVGMWWCWMMVLSGEDVCQEEGEREERRKVWANERREREQMAIRFNFGRMHPLVDLREPSIYATHSFIQLQQHAASHQQWCLRTCSPVPKVQAHGWSLKLSM